MLGFPDRALARVEEAVTLARKLAHPPSIMLALSLAIVLHCVRHDADAAREKIEAVSQIAHDGMPRYIPDAKLQMAYISALGSEQQAHAGMTVIQEALAAEEDVERKGFYLCLFACVCGLAGEADIGLNALKPAIEVVAATGARLWESELYRIAGDLLLGSASLDPEPSEAHYLRAIEVAREQHAASLDLRASTSLARLWAHRGDRRKAYDLLAPVYAWFTEGFDTRDLVDASETLDQLQ